MTGKTEESVRREIDFILKNKWSKSNFDQVFGAYKFSLEHAIELIEDNKNLRSMLDELSNENEKLKQSIRELAKLEIKYTDNIDSLRSLIVDLAKGVERRRKLRDFGKSVLYFNGNEEILARLLNAVSATDKRMETQGCL